MENVETPKEVKVRKPRFKKYNTEEERIAADKEAHKRYYQRNKAVIIERARQDYLEKMKDHEYKLKSKYAPVKIEKSAEKAVCT